ncbi:MAG: hypothetical protein JWN46_3183 [Acidimicrobiales bacterium]|nr:hypothetical protein [Acidimicrobiales bacterium]
MVMQRTGHARGRGSMTRLLRKPTTVAAMALGVVIGATQFPIVQPVANLVMASHTRAAQTPNGATAASSVQQAKSGVGPAPVRVSAKSPQATAPVTAAQIATARKLSELHPRPGPAAASTTPAATDASLGAPMPVAGPAAPTSFQTFRNSAPPTSSNASIVDEPSTDQSGRNILQTGNWYAAYSHTNGTSWTALNPFSMFGSGFCCDQVAKYDAGRDTQYWLLQYTDHSTIANSPSSDLTSWCSYNFTATAFGFPSGYEVDYNDLAVGTRFLYWTVNVFNTGGSFVGTVMARISLDDMKACIAPSFSYISRTDLFTLKVADGSHDVAWAGSSTPLDGGLGAKMKVLRWPENSTTVTTYTPSIPAFTYMSNGGGNCASADAVVNNWCQRTDSRILGATRGEGNLYFSWSAQQSGTSRPWPYTRVTRISESFVSVQANIDMYSTTVARLYTSLAADHRGHIGYVNTFGGGTGTTHYFPSGTIGVVDDVNTAWPGATINVVTGGGGGCLNTADNSFRWGDYNTVRAWPTGDGVWVATTFARTENSSVTCGTFASVNVRNVVFGRTRDLGNYTRFGSS